MWKLRKAVYDEDGTSTELPVYNSSLPESSKRILEKRIAA
jgi:hypothetical protein